MASPQLSVAVNLPASGIESHSTVRSPGKVSTNVGGVVSCTVMIWVWTVVKPHSSVAVHVLAIV